MFLKPKYFKKGFFNSIYKKIKNNIENKGIVIFNIKNAINELKQMHKNTIRNKVKNFNFTFDDMPFPNTNTLYIHLFNNKYYNDSIYINKKVEIERELLFLLAGNLGVKTINYDIDIIETTINKMNAGVNIKTDINVNFNKIIENKKGISGTEEYLNCGAPIYLNSNNLQEVNKHIEEKMGIINSNIFNYKFYKSNLKLEAFVHKRFEFKMLKLEYTIDTEDISDISFAVKSCFMDYGLNVSFDKSVSYVQRITYKLDFFTDLELKKEFGKIKRDHLDKFYSIRELYELMNDPDKSVHLIIEYVMEMAENYKYKLSNDETIYNFNKLLLEYIKNNPPGTFEGLCHQFQSTSQIKNWLNANFLEDNMELITNDKTTDKIITNNKTILTKPKDTNNLSIKPISLDNNNSIKYIELDNITIENTITPLSITPDTLSITAIHERMNIINPDEYINVIDYKEKDVSD